MFTMLPKFLRVGVQAVMLTLPEGPFPVIYADPAWAYRKSPLEDRGRARAVEKEYMTMQPEEIAALPVKDVAADDSVLFLWGTGPKLREALFVMDAWGFEYQTVAFVWVKLTTNAKKPFFGMGFYTRANAELVLVGTRGRGLRRKDRGVSQIVLDVEFEVPYDGPEEEQIATPIGRHSAKPDEIRRRIEQLYDGPRLEMFARENKLGWSVWGNEAPDAPPPPNWWGDGDACDLGEDEE